MKPALILATAKKYLPGILYTALSVFVLFLAYRLITRFKAGSMAVGGAIADTAENNAISNSTGINPTRVNELRGIALRLAKELETLKEMGMYDKATNLVMDADLLDILRGVKSVEEIQTVRNFYNNIFTYNRSLIEDLRDELSSSNLLKVPYVEGLY